MKRIFTELFISLSAIALGLNLSVLVSLSQIKNEFDESLFVVGFAVYAVCQFLCSIGAIYFSVEKSIEPKRKYKSKPKHMIPVSDGKKIFAIDKVIAVDFDGTLCSNEWPYIGEPNKELIDWIKTVRDKNKFILWTCRTGQQLTDAVNWCADQGIYFDAINDNLDEQIKIYGNNPRKINANYYIDDKNAFVEINKLVKA